MRTISLLATSCLLLGGCLTASPSNGALRCDTAGRCPTGYECAADDTCWRRGDSPAPSSSDGATPYTCPTGVQLCEEFETAKALLDSTSLPPFYPVNHSAQVTIDSTHAYRGAQSLRVHTDPVAAAGSSQGDIEALGLLPASGTIAMRAYFYISDTVSADAIILSLGTTDSSAGLTVRLEASAQLALQGLGATSTMPPSAPITLGEWRCIEWDVDIDTSATVGTQQLWLDDQPIGTTIVGATQTSPTLQKLAIGFPFYGTTAAVTARDVWIDSLILDDKHIGCAE